jgi:hypothetical protein
LPRSTIRRRGGRLAVFDRDNPQHGYPGHTAHAVKRGLLAVDQAFLGHVAKQRLKRNFLLSLQAKPAGDFTLARRRRRCCDEVEDLLARWQAWCGAFEIRHYQLLRWQ